MANRKTSNAALQAAYDAARTSGNGHAAATSLGLTYAAFYERYRNACERLNLPEVLTKAGGKIAVTLDPEQDSRLLSARQDVIRLKKAYAESIKDRTEEERLTRMFQRAITSFPAIPANHFKTPAWRQDKTAGTEWPVLLRGDQQIGEEVSFEETYGINKYDFNVFQARLESLEDRTLDILGDHQRANFPTLTVPYLGDNISGRIHIELQKYGHQHVIDQVYLGAAAEALFLYRLLKFGRWSRIVVPCLSGNHGRLDKEKESKKYYKNFDYLFTSIMATFLRNVPQIEFHIPQCLFTVIEIAGQRVLISHGHELPPSSLGIPLYSINRASASYQELLSLATEERFKYWFMGHFHRPLELDGSFVNGTMCGLSEFGIGRFKPIMPMQRLMGFHPKWGRAWEYPIQLHAAKPEDRKVYTFESAMTTSDALDLFAQQTKKADKEAA